MNNQKTVLAVDVGFGNTKAVWGAECTPQSEILFRSIVKRTMQDPAMFGDLGAGINRVGISIDGMYYLVGPDAYLAGGEPTIDPNFVNRVEYLFSGRPACWQFHDTQSSIIESLYRTAFAPNASSVS